MAACCSPSREETEEGWRIKWDAILPLPDRQQRLAHRMAVEHRTVEMQQRQNAASATAVDVRPVLTVGDAVGGLQAAKAAALGATVPVMAAAPLTGGTACATDCG
jgi:hypothetical protein